MDAMKDAQKKVIETAIKTAEDNAGTMAPAPLKMLFPCCGGPMGTLKKFECVIPADKKDDFNKAYESVQGQKEKLKNM